MEYFIFQLNITVAEFATKNESFLQVIADSYDLLMNQIEITNVTAVDSSGVTRLIHLQIGFFTLASSRAAVFLSDINNRLENQGFPPATIVKPPGMTYPTSTCLPHHYMSNTPLYILYTQLSRYAASNTL